MRILDEQSQLPLSQVAIYLTEKEAADLVEAVHVLMKDCEAPKRVLVQSEGRNLSVSIITVNKLKKLEGFSPTERDLFRGTW